MFVVRDLPTTPTKCLVLHKRVTKKIMSHKLYLRLSNILFFYNTENRDLIKIQNVRKILDT